MRSRVQKITPDKAAKLLQANTSNRPLSASLVRTLAETMARGDWQITHQGIAIAGDGTLVDGQHRLAAIVEAGIPVEMLVFTDVDPDTFDVLDTGRRRNAADVLAIEGEKSTHQLASMLRTVWLYDNRPDAAWSGGGVSVTNHQILQTLADNPRIRDVVGVGDQIAAATGMIKSAAGAASYLINRVNKPAKLTPWYDGIIDGAGLTRTDPRLKFRNLMLTMARKQAGQVQRRRDTREHIALYLKAFNAWANDETLTQLRYAPRETLPPVTVIR